ncbi:MULTISPECIES: hypothetical protein [unclassified Massilia]|uniref:hypothetical protein n=1 Tax=unclassified Massilia TaxID=2609279 RepID=UPI00177F7567|nr:MULTISPECIES: hypothetical protein [unclassified Massilia]MBD8531470.1 hypothetical protein [Massilia sp. CFBP 13647]MBD8673734.1 hypothetical protein [Massilia sp. CFBP 13721]
MRTFHVTVRTAGRPTEYIDITSQSAAEAWDRAAARVGDEPCGITVMTGGR